MKKARVILQTINWRIWLPSLFIFFGLTGVATAIGADLLNLGGGGFGNKQISLALAGGLFILIGAALATPIGWHTILRWGVVIGSDDQPVSLLAITVWFGLLAGLFQLLLWVQRRYLSDQPIIMGNNFLWLIPLANLIIFLAVGLVLHLTNKRWPKVLSVRMAVFVLSFLAFGSIILMFPALNIYAALILALGLSVQTARMSAKYNAGFNRLIRYTLGWPIYLLKFRKFNGTKDFQEKPKTPFQPTRRDFVVGSMATLGALVVAAQGRKSLAEQIVLATMPTAAPNSPNVLLIVLDTVRAQSLSLHGYERPTSPQLARLAKKGARFDRAISTSPWTLPSHASMFTGYYPDRLSTNFWVKLDKTYPTLAETLSNHGYATAGFAANVFYCSEEFGLSRGFAHYEDYPFVPGELALGTSLIRSPLERVGYNRDFLVRKRADRINRDFLRWLSRQKDHKPFFAFLNYYDAHHPFQAPSEFARQFSKDGTEISFTNKIMRTRSPDVLKELNDNYDGSIAYLDHYIGLLFDELESHGHLENTVVIITSDHGEQFGEHDLVAHANSLYIQLLHVPLIIINPSRVPEGVVISDPVTLRDIPATVFDLVGLGDQVKFPGTSLGRHWAGLSLQDGNEPNPLLSSINFRWFQFNAKYNYGTARSVFFDDMHYIKNPDATEELFDIADDPHEEKDLAKKEGYRPLTKQFRSILESMTDVA